MQDRANGQKGPHGVRSIMLDSKDMLKETSVEY
jgi:hypothetical protein